jgi:hypothetical protein
MQSDPLTIAQDRVEAAWSRRGRGKGGWTSILAFDPIIEPYVKA